MMKFLMYGVAVLMTACMTTPGEAKPVSISKEVQTVYMGRHQMELPADFEQSAGSLSIFTPPGLTPAGGPIKVAIKSGKIDSGQYKLDVDKRHAAILKAARKATDVLKEVIVLNKDATIFRIMEIDDAYKSELHLWKGGVYIVAITDSYENTFRQAEAHLGEDGDHLVLHLHDGVHPAGALRRRRQGQVDAVGGQPGVQLGGLQARLAFGDGGGDAVAQAVDQRTALAALVRGHRPQRLEQV